MAIGIGQDACFYIPLLKYEARDDKRLWCLVGKDPASEPREWLHLADRGAASLGRQVFQRQTAGGNPTVLGNAKAEVTVPSVVSSKLAKGWKGGWGGKDCRAVISNGDGETDSASTIGIVTDKHKLALCETECIPTSDARNLEDFVVYVPKDFEVSDIPRIPPIQPSLPQSPRPIQIRPPM